MCVASDIEVENCDLLELGMETRAIIEADSFWCTSRLLDGIQDNYTFAQPGIQMKVNALRELIKRIDGRLASVLFGSAAIAYRFHWWYDSVWYGDIARLVLVQIVFFGEGKGGRRLC